MFFIRKKLPRSHAPGEPPAVPGPQGTGHTSRVAWRRTAYGSRAGHRPAWLASALKPNKANAALSADIQALMAPDQCNVATNATGIPVICFDLAGGANLVGSEVIVGQQGGQANFLTTAGYGKMGLPGNMVPSAAGFTDATFGLLWHSDGGDPQRHEDDSYLVGDGRRHEWSGHLRYVADDTGQNPHNPMYGIAMVGSRGTLLNLVGNQSSVSGGNSASVPYMINPLFQPTTISLPSDDVGLVSTVGYPPTGFGGRARVASAYHGRKRTLQWDELQRNRVHGCALGCLVVPDVTVPTVDVSIGHVGRRSGRGSQEPDTLRIRAGGVYRGRIR